MPTELTKLIAQSVSLNLLTTYETADDRIKNHLLDAMMDLKASQEACFLQMLTQYSEEYEQIASRCRHADLAVIRQVNVSLRRAVSQLQRTGA